MTLLSAAQVDAMRVVLDESLPDTAVIKTQTYNSDGGGGGTTVWTASGTVDCRIAPARSVENERGDRISPDADWVITLPAETTITRESRIVVDSVTYSVSGINAPRSWELSRRIDCVEVT